MGRRGWPGQARPRGNQWQWWLGDRELAADERVVLRDRCRDKPWAIERGAAEIMALHQADALAPQDRRVFRGGDAFGHGVKAEPLRQPEQVAQENLVLRVAGEIGDERAV